MFGFGHKLTMVDATNALAGRAQPIRVRNMHAALDTPIQPPFPAHLKQAVFGLGCFWGAERLFWKLPGVYSTAVGYAGGFTPNANYDEVCSGQTGHTEVVLVVYDPSILAYAQLLKAFWEGHDPTQGMRQGNDVGTQYRSAIYTFDDDQLRAANESKHAYERTLQANDYDGISTEVRQAPPFYYAEEYHQQYLHKNPGGYCGLGGTGLSCTIPG